jgi:hypothetical protein
MAYELERPCLGVILTEGAWGQKKPKPLNREDEGGFSWGLQLGACCVCNGHGHWLIKLPEYDSGFILYFCVITPAPGIVTSELELFLKKYFSGVSRAYKGVGACCVL